MKLCQRYLFPLWLLLGICSGSVINRKARNFEDDLDKREGFKKQLDDLTEAVKKLQDEFENNDKSGYERRNSFTRRVSLDESNKEKEDKKNTTMDRFKGSAALGEKILEAGVKLLTRELSKGKDKEEKKESDTSTKESTKGKLEKRTNPAVAQMGAKAGEKAVEMGAKVAEKQMEINEKHREKVGQFLGEEIKLDITGDKGWQTDDMFIPPGYHMDAKVIPESKPAPAVSGQQPFTFPFGAGGLIMNGCFGSGYQPGDRCYDATWATTKCLDLIPGATFIGVGFDGRGDYSPESSRMDLVQRACARKQRYNGKMIPDTMKLLGVYDTSANMQVFYSRSEYQKYLEQQSGVSGSGFGFYAGVKNAWGSSTTEGKQKYLAVFDIDVDRYEIFMDVVKPDNLNIEFLREFMMLPTSYYEPGAALKFQDFIQRFGTHYIKAGRFGGQLEIRKSMDASEVSSQSEFSQVMEFEFKSFFASAGARSSDKEGERARSQTKTSSTSMSIQGGSQDIAAVISDVYAPTFKAEFKEWLKSIPQFPKAFKFTIAPITSLLDFRSSDLFPAETPSFGCEAHRAELKKDHETNRYYYNATVNGTRVKEFCDYLSREALEYAIRQRRSSLKRAIDVYMEEGSISVSDISLSRGTPGCQTQNYKYQMKAGRPTWEEMTTHRTAFKVIFKMDSDLTGLYHGKVKIPSHLECLVRYIGGEWVVSTDYDKFDFFSGCNRGGSGSMKSEDHYICIYGLLLKYDERMGALNLDEQGFNISKQTFTMLDANLIGAEMARVEWPADHIFQMREVVGYLPCNVKWSNALRFDPGGEGRCLHFTASTKGTVFVIFSVIPKDKDTWYYVQISPYGVGIFKTLKVSSVDVDAVGLGDQILYQPYFVCVTQEPDATIIEYGKSQGTTEKGEIYLSMIDKEKTRLHVRFYAFGNGEDALEITDAHVLKRSLIKAECKGDTTKDVGTHMCIQKCHEMCDPLKGCKSTSTGEPLPTDCNACLYLKRVDSGECVKTCPEGYKEKDATCVPRGCQKNPCMNGGSCKDLGDEKYQCQCTKVYRGHHCEIANNPCHSNPCKNGGKCGEDPKRPGHFECSCPSGLGGETCEIDNCPDGWKEFESFCYKFDLENEISFREAVKTCRQMKAELLVVNSIQENRFIEGQITSDNFVWLGITLRRGLDASWELLNGKEATFELLEESDTDAYKQYISYGDRLCAVLARDDHWIQVECVRGGYANTVCKRPFSG